MKLDLGCGQKKRDGFIGVDHLPLKGVDIVHELDSFPYPFEDSSVGEIWMDQVLEHLDSPLAVLDELARIAKPGAVVTIGVPYFRSFYAVIDPTHKSLFSAGSLNYVLVDHPWSTRYAYSKARFRLKKLEFDREFKSAKLGLFHRSLIWFAERKPTTYEARLSHLFPLNSLTFHLEVVK